MPRPALLFLVLLSAALPLATRAETSVDPRPDAWSRADGINFGQYLRQPAMLLQGGPYVALGSNVANGRIDVDVALHGQRGFVGVLFRHADDNNYELFYLRPHKSRLPDAVQYAPTINGQSTWQLYHARKGATAGTASAELPHSRWVHVTVEFIGREASLYLDGGEEPALTVPLQGDLGAGGVGLWGRNVAHFANFRYTAYDNPRIPPRPAFTPPDDIVGGWSLSPTFEAGARSPLDVPAGGDWTPAALEAPGVVNISRWRSGYPDDRRTVERGRPEDLVYARTTIRADRAGMRKLWVAYSDAVTVLLNGQPVFEGRARFNERYPFALGLLGFGQEAVWLPLEAGDNELVFAVTEDFGGWGFGARWGD